MPDEPTPLGDDAVLWTRPPNRLKYPEQGRDTIGAQGSSFRGRSGEDGVSVTIASYFTDGGLGPLDMLNLGSGDESWGVLEITAGEVRALEGFDVELDEADQSHALIKPCPGPSPSKKLTQVARWAHYPRFP